MTAYRVCALDPFVQPTTSQEIFPAEPWARRCEAARDRTTSHRAPGKQLVSVEVLPVLEGLARTATQLGNGLIRSFQYANAMYRARSLC
jgi:hypothetical protein